MQVQGNSRCLIYALDVEKKIIFSKKKYEIVRNSNKKLNI